MNKFFAVLLFAAVVAGFSSCKKVIGKGPVVTEDRTASNFSAINLGVPAVLRFTQSPEYKVSISAQQNVLNVLETRVSGNELLVKLRDNTVLGRRETVVVEVRAPNISSFSVNGSGSITVPEKIIAGDLTARVNGSGDIRLNHIIAHTFKSNVNGSGSITVAGDEIEQSYDDVNGSGDIFATDLPAREVKSVIHGSGKIRITALEKLIVNISGSGKVYYRGTPDKEIRISGSGKVISQ